MFAGIITCGVCGRSFSRRDRGTSTLWLCRNYIKKSPTGCSSKGIRERLLKEIVSSTLGEGGLEEVDRVDNITVYPDSRLIITVDDEEIEKAYASAADKRRPECRCQRYLQLNVVTS